MLGAHGVCALESSSLEKSLSTVCEEIKTISEDPMIPVISANMKSSSWTSKSVGRHS